MLAVGACASDASTGRWRALEPSPLERTEVGAARIGKFIYVVGGYDGRNQTTAAVARYDIDRDRWTRVRSMPIGLNHTQAVAYKRNLYVFGGNTGDGPSNRLFRYRPKRDRWSRLANAPTARSAHALGVIGDRLYVAGGRQ